MLLLTEAKGTKAVMSRKSCTTQRCRGDACMGATWRSPAAVKDRFIDWKQGGRGCEKRIGDSNLTRCASWVSYLIPDTPPLTTGP